MKEGIELLQLSRMASSRAFATHMEASNTDLLRKSNPFNADLGPRPSDVTFLGLMVTKFTTFVAGDL